MCVAKICLYYPTESCLSKKDIEIEDKFTEFSYMMRKI